MSIVLIDADASTLTISWSEIPGDGKYHLQFKKISEDDWATLSDSLASPQARKRNLEDSQNEGFLFRVSKNSTDSSWITHNEPFRLLTKDHDQRRMKTPIVDRDGSHAALLISWEGAKTTKNKYEIQMRPNVAGVAWSTIAASFEGKEVRKKNLSGAYQFRVRPVDDGSNDDEPFSPPSPAVEAIGLSNGLKNLFSSLENNSLVRGNDRVSLQDGIGGKQFVLLYASAHWCGPCRQFTPMLTQWYNSMGSKSAVEVVFLSADHDRNGFQSYFDTMPWLAVDFDDDTREQLMAHIHTSGIPRLAVLDSTGRIIEDNAVGKALDINRWRKLAGH